MKITLVQPITLLASAGDGAPRRMIDGVAVPYNVAANASTGPVMFEPGSLPTDGPAPKLLRNHDPADPVGIVVERVSTDTEMLFSARISATSAGDEALVLAADGVYDGVSVGVDIIRHRFDNGVMVVEAGEWRELSLVTFPAFSDARILDVAATEGDTVDNPDTEETHQPEEPEITEPLTEVSAMADIEAATHQTAPLIVGGALTRPRTVTAGEYISAMLTGRPLPQIQAADNVLSDIGGLLPEPLIGDVWNTQYAQRPLTDAVGTRALPGGGEIFVRRYISQHTDVAEQVSEFDNLASAPLQVARQTFTKKTFGGFVNTSSQAGDWSEPALVQAIVNDMIRQYARATETYVVTQMTTAAKTAATTIADYTDGDEVVAGLYDGASEMFGATGAMPTHLIVHSDVWSQLGQAKTAGGAYIFPYLNPSNAAGQMTGGAAVMNGNPLGLSLIVANDVGSGNAVLLYGAALEVYEDRSRTGGIRVENPATASATIGLWGYIAADIIAQTGAATSDYALFLN
jgi:hypothetical protein